MLRKKIIPRKMSETDAPNAARHSASEATSSLTLLPTARSSSEILTRRKTGHNVLVRYPKGKLPRAFFHEVKMTLIGGVVVTLVLYGVMHGLGIKFPNMHLPLVFMALICFPYFDMWEYPHDPSGTVYGIRAVVNLLVVLIGFLSLAPLAEIKSPGAFVGVVIAWLNITSLIAALRALIHSAVIIVKIFCN